MVSGMLCLVGSGVSWSKLRTATEDRQVVATTLKQAALQNPNDREEHRALLMAHRRQASIVALWKRRRLGLFLTAGVLLVGGFVAEGFRRRHYKAGWYTVGDEMKPLGACHGDES